MNINIMNYKSVQTRARSKREREGAIKNIANTNHPTTTPSEIKKIIYFEEEIRFEHIFFNYNIAKRLPFIFSAHIFSVD